MVQVKTPFAVLMHNDAYPMEPQFVCEMVRALEAHPEYPIAAPTIYEKGADNIYVPHGPRGRRERESQRL